MARISDHFLCVSLAASAVGVYFVQRIGAHTIKQLAASRMSLTLSLPLNRIGAELRLIQRVTGGLALVFVLLPFFVDFGERGNVSNAVVPLTLGVITAVVGIGWQAWFYLKSIRGMARHDIRRQFSIMAFTMLFLQVFSLAITVGAIANSRRAILNVKL